MSAAPADSWLTFDFDFTEKLSFLETGADSLKKNIIFSIYITYLFFYVFYLPSFIYFECVTSKNV